MMTSDSARGLTRRGVLQGAAGALAAAAAGLAMGDEKKGGRRSSQTKDDSCKPAKLKGNINHSVCQWCFTGDCSVKPMTLDELCQNAVKLGLKSVELVEPQDWDTLKKHGLVCAIANSHGFVKGFNDPANWEMCIDKIKKAVDDCAAAGFPTVITFSGFREKIPDDVGLENTVKGLKKVVGYAEKKKINLCIEILNSRVDVEMKGHPGYMGDKVEWCGEVCKQISSPRMLMLFDIYHVQIMEGDVITRIKQWKDYIGHYHTAGNPGRNEMDDTQEIHYPGIMKAIVATGYKGYVGHEFIPTRDPVGGLRAAVQLCDV